MQRSNLSLTGVKSFVAHVAGVSIGAVLGLAAVVVFGMAAPMAAGYAAVGLLGVAGMVAGAKGADVLYHWAHEDAATASTSTNRERLQAHFSGHSL